jgi:hypothetical protein
MRAAVVVIVLWICSPTAAAQPSADQRAKQEAAAHFVHERDLATSIANQLIAKRADLTDEDRSTVKSWVREHMQLANIEAEMVRYLESNFSVEEIDAMSGFFSSAAGRSAQEKSVGLGLYLGPMIETEMKRSLAEFERSQFGKHGTSSSEANAASAVNDLAVPGAMLQPDGFQVTSGEGAAAPARIKTNVRSQVDVARLMWPTDVVAKAERKALDAISSLKVREYEHGAMQKIALTVRASLNSWLCVNRFTHVLLQDLKSDVAREIVAQQFGEALKDWAKQQTWTIGELNQELEELGTPAAIAAVQRLREALAAKRDAVAEAWHEINPGVLDPVVDLDTQSVRMHGTWRLARSRASMPHRKDTADGVMVTIGAYDCTGWRFAAISRVQYSDPDWRTVVQNTASDAALSWREVPVGSDSRPLFDAVCAVPLADVLLKSEAQD